ncbi:MAG: hypothetical protein ACREO8_06405 [Luteimonas sp.]
MGEQQAGVELTLAVLPHKRRDFSSQPEERSMAPRCGSTAKACSSLRLATPAVAANISLTASKGRFDIAAIRQDVPRMDGLM